MGQLSRAAGRTTAPRAANSTTRTSGGSASSTRPDDSQASTLNAAGNHPAATQAQARTSRKGKRKFSDEIEAEIVRLYVEERRSTVQLAKLYGCTNTSIGKILKRNGIKARNLSEAKGGLTKEQQAEVCERYISGQNTMQLAKLYGCRNPNIGRILKRNGIKMRSRSEAQGGLTKEQEAEVIRLYVEERRNTVQIGELYGVANVTIGDTLKRNGIKMRSLSEAKTALTKEQELEVCERYIEGENKVQLAKLYGVAHGTIRNILRRHNIPTRGNTVTARAQTFRQSLLELVESLGDHIHQLPLKSWLLILQQSKALQSVGDQSALANVKIQLLEGRITPDDLATEAASPQAGGKLQEALAEAVAAADPDAIEPDEPEPTGTTAEPLDAEPLDVIDEPEARKRRLLELEIQPLVDAVTAASRVMADEQALALLVATQVELIWARCFGSTDPAAVAQEALAATADSPWAQAVLDSFRADWELTQGAREIPGFRGNLTLNLMQQREAALLQRDRRRLNVSAPGAGKTLAGLAGVHLAGCRRVLVLAPNAALGAWTDTLAGCFPLAEWQTKTWQPEWSTGEPKFLINNHEMMADGSDAANANSLAQLLLEWEPDALIIDEIHLCKSRSRQQESQRHRNLKFLTEYMREQDAVIYGLSGTPVINELGEIVSLLNLIDPALVDGLETKRTIENCMRIHAALQPISSRYVPPAPCSINDQTVTVRADHLLGSVLIASECSLSSLEAVLAKPKIEALPGLLDRNQKTVIFTSAIRDVVEPARFILEQAGFTVAVHTGEEKDHKGQRSVDAFIHDPRVDVLIASTGTLATGFDGLQHACNRLVFLSLPWTAAEREQAIARVARQGTPFSTVEVLTLSAVLTDPISGEPWSLDEQKLQRLLSKRSICAAVCDGVIPEVAALQYSEESTKRALKTWAQRIQQQKVSQPELIAA
jgi:superfamily II DNA or RNA helicase/transposase-like protein